MIRSLELKNFTRHEDRRLDLSAPVTVVVGPNASGKSSIKDAIEWALTGACRSTDAAGRGYAGLIRVGTDKMQVALHLPRDGADDLVVTRSATPKGSQLSVTGWQGPQTVIQGQLLSLLGRNGTLKKNQLHALLNSTYFFSLSRAEQARMLAEALGIDVDRTAILEQATTDAAMAILDEILTGIPDRLSGLALVSAVHSALKEERRLAKRELDRLTKQADDKPELELPEGVSVSDKDRAVKLLTELRSRRDELLKRKAQVEATQDERRRLESQINALSSRCDEIEARLGKLKGSEEDIKQLEGQISQIEGEYQKLTDKIAEVSAQLDARRGVLQTLSSAEGICPLVTEVACPLMADHSDQSLLDRIKNEVSDLERAQAEASTLREALQAKREQLQAERDRLSAEAHEREALSQSLAQYGEQIESMSKRLGEILKMKTEKTEAIEEELAELEARISKGEAVTEAIAKREALEEHLKARQEQIARAREKVKLLEELVSYFDPRGKFVTSMVEQKIKPFSEALKATVADLTGDTYSAEIELEPEIAVKVTKSDGTVLPVENLSSSERLRVGIGIQVALAETVGFPFIAIDNADMLDSDARAFLHEAVERIRERGIQLLILATGEKPEAEQDSVRFIELS